MPTALNELLAQNGIRKKEFADKSELSQATVNRLCNNEDYVASEATYGKALRAFNDLRVGAAPLSREEVFPERFNRGKPRHSELRAATKTKQRIERP